MEKADLIQQIIRALAVELEGYDRSARAAHEEATDEQSKAENKYDTRGLEASYLARGQARQAAEVRRAMQQLGGMHVRKFRAGEAIDIGALVEVVAERERTFYFIGPCAGGTEIRHGENAVLVLTPQSPLGQQLFGKVQGDRLELRFGAGVERARVAAVT